MCSALAPAPALLPRVVVQVNSLDDMDAVHRKMEGLGPLHHRNSVRAYEHMPIFETVVVALLEQVGRSWGEGGGARMPCGAYGSGRAEHGSEHGSGHNMVQTKRLWEWV